jgi:hypothetical protein
MAIDTFANFDLLILPFADHYQARVTSSPVGQAITYFDFPFTAAELQSFSWLSGRDISYSRTTGLASESPMSVRSFGSRLYDASFSGEVGQCLVRCLDVTRSLGQGLRIRLHLNDVAELADLPWEYLYASGPHGGFLALSEATPVVRFLELPLAADVLPIVSPLRILAVVADPQDVSKLEVEREWLLLQEALGSLQSRQLIKLERLERPTVSALQRRLRQIDGDIHVLHFIGHAHYDAVQASGGIFLEDEKRNHHFVVGEDLAMLLHDHRSLQLVFLNACEGARSSDAYLFAGTAQTLVQRGIPTVLAMQFPISDGAATALTHEFYQALTSGLHADAAIGEARKAIKAAGSEMEWGTPVLFMRAATGLVVKAKQGTDTDNPSTRQSTTPTRKDPAPMTINTTDLRRSIAQSFSPDELRLLCADLLQMLTDTGVSPKLLLDLEWDSLPGNSRESKIDALIRFLQRRQLLEFLVESVRKERPDIF